MFKALSDPGRLGIIDTLAQGEFCVSELAEFSGDEVYTVSQRLRILRSEKLVERRREGKHVYYRLADCHISELVRNAFAHAEESELTPP